MSSFRSRAGVGSLSFLRVETARGPAHAVVSGVIAAWATRSDVACYTLAPRCEGSSASVVDVSVSTSTAGAPTLTRCGRGSTPRPGPFEYVGPVANGASRPESRFTIH
jgi:hypothetical protein